MSSKGAPTWFKTVWSYNVEAIDHGTIFSMKTKKKIEVENCIGIIKFISQFSELRCGRY
jgi:hypothetical protein